MGEVMPRLRVVRSDEEVTPKRGGITVHQFTEKAVEKAGEYIDKQKAEWEKDEAKKAE